MSQRTEDMLQIIQEDPYLTIDDNGNIDHKFFPSDSNRGSTGLDSKISTLKYQNILYVLDYFRENQIDQRWIRKWSPMALSRYIRYYIFRGEMGNQPSRRLALLILNLTFYGDVL